MKVSESIFADTELQEFGLNDASKMSDDYQPISEIFLSFDEAVTCRSHCFGPPLQCAVSTSSLRSLTASQPIETVDGAQVLQAVLLGQDKHHRVVAVPAARVHLATQ